VSYNTLKENLPTVNDKLRQSFDSNDPIRMAFRIGGLHRNGGRRGSRVTPDWALKSKKMRKILLRSFPRMHEKTAECKNDHRYCRCPYHQHWLAARWAYIAYLYWGRKLTRGQIVCELNEVDIGEENSPAIWNCTKVRLVLYHLKRSALGLRSSRPGRGKGYNKEGRPKKTRETTAASIKDDTNEPRSNR
jgi:hypothetical protein